jgi:hypothetical protein
VVDYLAGEGLVESLADEAPLVKISHRGVVEVEQSLTDPKEPTEHFVQQVIQHFHGSVGSVQTGNQNVAQVTQTAGLDSQVSELLQTLRRQIVEEFAEHRVEGIELLDGLEAEVNSETRSESRIKLYLKGLGSFAKGASKDVIVKIGTKLISDQFGLS